MQPAVNDSLAVPSTTSYDYTIIGKVREARAVLDCMIYHAVKCSHVACAQAKGHAAASLKLCILYRGHYLGRHVVHSMGSKGVPVDVVMGDQ